MDRLTPSAQRTLYALTAGPGNVHQLSERAGRSRSTTDKAINELAKAGLIVKVDDGGDPADGAPTRWQLAAPTHAPDEASQPADGAPAIEPDTDNAGAARIDAVPPAEAPEPALVPDSPESAYDAPPATDLPAAASDQTDDGPVPDAQPGSTATLDGQASSDGDAATDGEGTQDGEDKRSEAEPPKLCRGCQAQMPKICECCWQKTPAYCGACRRTMPQVRRGEPGEPIILSNGLPKLRPGELEALVEKVMREHPLPAFAGIVGWTGGRVAIHLPGRSPGAITNAMRKFVAAGMAELIGDSPERFRLINTEKPDAGANDATGGDGKDAASRVDTTEHAAAGAGPADAATEPQPTTAA